MGTTFDISVWAAPGREPAAADAIATTLDDLARLEARVSSWTLTSDTSAVNEAAGALPVRVGPELLALLTLSLRWGRRTGGAFDVTGGPLYELWRQARADRRRPEPAALAAAHALVGQDKVTLKDGAVQLALPGMRLGFGAIGKGFAADRASAALRARGFANHVIDAGGDLVLAGRRGTRPWDVGVRHPRHRGMLARVRATDCAVATSGDYEQYETIDGVRHGHIIDPRSGRPALGVVSVTVFAPTGATADALATGLFVLGPREGLALVGRLRGTEALFVTDAGAVRLSSGLRLDGDHLERAP